jgi:hypothetical protein
MDTARDRLAVLAGQLVEDGALQWDSRQSMVVTSVAEQIDLLLWLFSVVLTTADICQCAGIHTSM